MPNAANPGKCEHHTCRKGAAHTCTYCYKRFCKVHLPSFIPTSFQEMSSIPRHEVEKLKKYDDDWIRVDGHRCHEYKKAWDFWHLKKATVIGSAQNVPIPPEPKSQESF